MITIFIETLLGYYVQVFLFLLLRLAMFKGNKLAHLLIRYYSIIILFGVGSFLSYATFVAVNYYQSKENQHLFEVTFRDKVMHLSHAVSSIDKVFQAASSLISLSPQLNQQAFSHLINDKFLENTGMQGVHWAPAIEIEKHKTFENFIIRSGVFDYKIRNISRSSAPCSLTQNSLIYPVLFAEPADAIGHEQGLELSSDCHIAKGMRIALEQKQFTSVGFTDENGDHGFRLLKPIFNPDSSIRGFIVGTVMVNNLVDTLLSDLTTSVDYNISIYQDQTKNKKIYGSQWRAACDAECEQRDTLVLHSSIPVANQIWHIDFSKVSRKSLTHYYGYAAATLLMAITFGFAVFIWSKINRIRWANELVNERTKSLQHQAHHDSLTQLLNREALADTLEELTQPDQDVGFSVLFIDLDHFKKINDTKGHLVGDKILQQVATRLTKVTREDDFIFRFGGDEFVVLLNKTHVKHRILDVAQSILTQIQSEFIIDDTQYHIGASIGVSVITSSKVRSADILRNADIAMYEAKNSGRGKVVFFNSDMYQNILHKQVIETSLINATTQNQLRMHLQPIHQKTKIKGFEALCRWQHPSEGLIFPNDFIPIAEETGLINQLGQWMIEEACQQLALWLKYYDEATCPYISINVSPIQLLQTRIYDQIACALKQYQIPGHLLVIELTESALIENKTLVNEQLKALKGLGIRVFLDDFGTGFSSLSLLQDFPIDVLKIDRSFIIGVSENNRESKKLLTAIIKMAEALNMQVIAEGVEDIATLNWLYDMQCHLAQGYYFAKPLSPEQLGSYLRQHMPKHASQFCSAPLTLVKSV